MKIETVEVAYAAIPLPKGRGLSGGPITHSTDLVCRITTTDGVWGIGETRGSPLSDTARLLAEALAPMLLGEHAMETEYLWQKMHAALFPREVAVRGWDHLPQARTRLSAIAAVDLALWVIKARAAGLSVCRLLGGHPHAVPAYLSEGFYIEGQSVSEMAEEAAAALAAGGYRALKIRIGRDPEDDRARVRAVREAVGPDVALMVDVNQAWDLEKARRTLPLLEGFDLYWLEEPVRVRRGGEPDPDALCGEVAALTRIPIAAGENHTTLGECRSLVERGGIRFMQFDAIKNGGVTEFLKVAALCQAHDIPMAPHHVPHFHVHLAAAVPHGAWVETFENAKQHVAWPHLFDGFPVVRAGHMAPPEGGGWGMAVNEDFLSRHGVKVRWRA